MVGCTVADRSHLKGYWSVTPPCDNEIDHDCGLGHASSPCKVPSECVEEPGTMTYELLKYCDDCPDVVEPACESCLPDECFMVTAN